MSHADHFLPLLTQFLAEAHRQSKHWHSLTLSSSRQPFNARKSVHFHLSTLQSLDPARPWSTTDGGVAASGLSLHSTSGTIAKKPKIDTDSTKAREPLPPRYSPSDDDATDGSVVEQADEPLVYDVIWCQWMLQHLSDEDLKSFFTRAKAALVKDDGVIVVKENVCAENEDGTERVWWDEEDKSITR